MSIYQQNRSSRIHRVIYEQHHGPIPKEENGRSYDIHHIDGNHLNNDPLNLKAVTLQEHYDIHYSQGDWGACRMIALRLNKSADDIANLSKASQLKLVENGTHHFMKRMDGTSFASDQVLNGTHPFLGGHVQRITNRKLLASGTHCLQKRADGTSVSSDLVASGKHHLLNAGKNHPQYKSDIYTFSHSIFGIENCTGYELRQKYKDINQGNLSQLISGKLSSVRGWKIIS